MQRVNGGRDEIEGEEKPRGGGVRPAGREEEPRNEMFVVFNLVFDTLEDEEDAAEQGRRRENDGRDTAHTEPYDRYSPCDEEAAGEQDRGVCCPDRDLRMPRSLGEAIRIREAVDAVAQDQPAEEQHLGREKHPHAELRGLVLLTQVDELERRRVRHFADEPRRRACIRRAAASRAASFRNYASA